MRGWGEVYACAGKCMLEEDDDSRLEAQLQSTDGTREQISGTGRPLDRLRSLDGLSDRPHGGLQLLGGPSKPGPVEDPQSTNLVSGLAGPDPILSTSNEVGLLIIGLTIVKDLGWAKAKETFVAPRPDICQGPSQPLVKDIAQVSVAHPLVLSGPSLLRGSDPGISIF